MMTAEYHAMERQGEDAARWAGIALEDERDWGINNVKTDGIAGEVRKDAALVYWRFSTPAKRCTQSGGSTSQATPLPALKKKYVTGPHALTRYQ